MARTSIKKETSEETVEPTVIEKADEYDSLKKENEDLRSLINELKASIEDLKSKSNTQKNESTLEMTSVDAPYPEPDANSQIKVMSMYYGELNLCDSANRSTGRLLTFTEFGQIKSVMYRDLVNYINNEMKFAEQGLFYVLDKAAVYHLGLSEAYTKLADPAVMKNITTYTNSEIEKIIEVMNPTQRETLSDLLADRIYKGISYDLNKIHIIERYGNIKIMEKVDQKKQIESNNQKSNEQG